MPYDVNTIPIHFKRVRGAALTSVKESMTEGLLPSTSLPPSIQSSTTLPPTPQPTVGGLGSGGMDGGRENG